MLSFQRPWTLLLSLAMEAITKLIHSNGCGFELGLEEVFREMYEPLYRTPSPNVKQIKDIRYGTSDRNLLDVFVPLSGSPGKTVLIFVHGGGFFSGDKAWSDKVYANIGELRVF